MECPSYRGRIELTWALYFKAFFGKFRCPRCRPRLLFRHDRVYYLWLVVLGLVAALRALVGMATLGFVAGLFHGTFVIAGRRTPR